MNETSPLTSPTSGGPDSLEDLVHQIPRVGQSVSQYLSSTLQLLLIQLKKNLFATIFWILFIILIFQMTAIAISLLLHGAGEGVGLLLGQRIWLGNIVVGGTFILLVLFGGFIGWKALNRSLKRKSQKPAGAEESFQEALGSIKEDVRGIFKIQAWVERYPIPTTGAVAVLGFWVGGNLFQSFPEEIENLSSQETSSQQIPWVQSLANVLVNTGSDILKDAAHLWVQKNLETIPPQTPKDET